MTLHEPMTFATDVALGALTAVFAAKLLRRAHDVGSPAMRAWGAAFATSAAAAIGGGVFHGFRPALGAFPAGLLWKATVLLLGVTSFFLFVSAVRATLTGTAARFCTAAAAVQLLFYAAWMTQYDAFRYVIYDYATGMLGVGALNALRLCRDRAAPGAWWILAGIALSFVGAGVQYARVAPHPRFNHNDLYHVVQMAATTLLYRGGRGLPRGR